MNKKYKHIAAVTILLIGLFFIVRSTGHYRTADITELSPASMAEYTSQRSLGIALPELPGMEQMAVYFMSGSLIGTISEKQGNSSYLRIIVATVLYISLLTLPTRLKSGLFAYLTSRIKVIDSLLSQIQIIHQMDGKKRNSTLL